jgi:hypothetical protein
MFSFVVKGFKEITSPKDLCRQKGVRWFTLCYEKVIFRDGKISLHKHNVVKFRYEGIVLSYK